MRLLALSTIILVVRASASESVLGKLSWCSTNCLCNKITTEEVHCFSLSDIYSLVQIDERSAQRLESANFNFIETLSWCSDTCLCHKNGGKEFKCTSSENLKKIPLIAPHLAPYFKPDSQFKEVPLYITNEQTSEEIKSKGKKKNRKRKNKKKHLKENTTTEDTMRQAEEKTESPWLPDTMALYPQYLSHSTYSADIVDKPQGNVWTPEYPLVKRAELSGLYREMEKLKSKLKQLEINNESNESDETDELQELSRHVHVIQQAVVFNTFILYICSVASAVIFLGFIILSIVICCGNCSKRKSEKDVAENIRKDNITEAW